ncbi:MAG TPA: Hpt domain-containing protein [Gemmatimonadaceae bacterium]|jgi:hypothetical protein
MTGVPPGGAGQSGFVEFFILEAGEYLEQLDGLLLHASTAGVPDTGAMQRIARALRGSATMAKLPPFAELAGAIERVGRALHQGSLRWSPAINGALISAVDDLKILLRASRSWGPAEDQRAATRTAELSRFAPAAQPIASRSSTPPVAPTSFLSTEAANVAAGLELLAARAGDADTAANVLRRVRALRGIAGVKEIAPLADTLEATEDAARGLEHGEELTPEGRQLLEAAGGYLRTIARGLRGEDGADVNAPSAPRDAFSAALENWSNRTAQTAQVVPIGHLFFEDGTLGVVATSPNPPTSSSERFRLELVSLGEHLKQIVSAARGAHDSGSNLRARRDLKRAVRDAQMTAHSFGEADVAAFIDGHLDAADHIDFLGLAALDDLASSLADAGIGGAHLRSRASEMADRRDLASSIATGLGSQQPPADATPQPSLMPRTVSPLAIETPVYTPAIVAPPPTFAPLPVPTSAPAPTPAPVPMRPSVPTFAALPPVAESPLLTPMASMALVPTPPLSMPPVAMPPVEMPTVAQQTPAHALPSIDEFTEAATLPTHALDSTSAALIQDGIAALDTFNQNPFFEPEPWGEDESLTPIDTLLYRGRPALDRAIALRDEIRGNAGGPRRETLDELFDLLDLARAE